MLYLTMARIAGEDAKENKAYANGVDLEFAVGKAGGIIGMDAMHLLE